MSEPVFRLDQYASEFVTRDIGRRLRERLLEFHAMQSPDERITIEASGVSIMTPSFVDEFFGRTAALLGLQGFKNRFRLNGIDDNTKQLINNVVRNRLIMETAGAGSGK